MTRQGLEGPSKTALLYNTLYVLFESLWYAKRLPLALADTRIPTHTVFDHLYASATLANLFLFWQNVGKPKGFLVLIDFPGITKFVNSGREAGDFWASSWLLLNLMWGVAEEFVRIYGLDVIVKPTPRLNPYSMRYIIASLAEVPEFEVSCINPRNDLTSKICNVFKAVLGSELDSMWLQPLVPATIELALPPIWRGAEALDEDTIKERVMEIYKRVWRHIFDYVMEKLAENVK